MLRHRCRFRSRSSSTGSSQGDDGTKLSQVGLLAPDSTLTEREVQVARLTLRGAETSEIAARLYVSGGTVRNHQSSIIAKTGARNRFEAARVAEENGWL